MVPPSPYLLRDVGDPQVTRNLRSVFRSLRSSFLPPWELALMHAVCVSQKFHAYHQTWAMIPFPPDAWVPPRLEFKQSSFVLGRPRCPPSDPWYWSFNGLFTTMLQSP